MTENVNLEIDTSTQAKWLGLLDLIRSYGSVMVGFSGGVDSGLLSVAAHQVLGERMLAITIQTPVETAGSMEVARKLAAQFGFPHEIIQLNDLGNEQFTANPPDRCYVCKQMDFGLIQRLAQQRGFAEVLEGSNADDLSDYRPGRKAAGELGVRAPLVDVSLTKPEIRAIARSLGMSNWDRPSSPCLASRFPYGTRITEDGLHKVAAGEAYLQKLGFREVRTRYGGASVRIEVNPAEIDRLLEKRTEVVPFFKSLGYKYVLLDLEGYRMGSLNEVLPGR